MPLRVALVTHELTGGVGTMTRFVHRVLSESGRFDSRVILLATSAGDSASARLRRPATWSRGPVLVEGEERGLSYVRVGAWLSELEFQRYRPRRALTGILERFDIIQFVCGTAPWVEVSRELDKPKCLWVATTNAGDRASRAAEGPLARRAWSSVMRAAAEVYETRALRAADSVLALSPYTMRSIQPKLRGRTASLAFCGVDTELFRPRREYDLPEQARPRYILCVARLSDARKNVAMLLRAYASLALGPEPMPDLYLVGEPLSAAGAKLVETLGIADRVRSLGPKHDEELARLYRGAEFFVLSSDEEGLGIVILEAMASGLAVVSTASGGPDVAVTDGETGFLTPVGNQEALAGAMRSLAVDSELRNRFGREGRKVAEARFSLRSAGEVFLDQYDRLVVSQQT